MRKATGKRVFQKLGEVRIRHEHGKTDRCSTLFLLLHVPLPHSGASRASKLSKGLESSMANVFLGKSDRKHGFSPAKFCHTTSPEIYSRFCANGLLPIINGSSSFAPGPKTMVIPPTMGISRIGMYIPMNKHGLIIPIPQYGYESKPLNPRYPKIDAEWMCLPSNLWYLNSFVPSPYSIFHGKHAVLTCLKP